MKIIHVSQITEAIKKLYIEACYNISDDIKDLLIESYKRETSPTGKSILQQLIENIEYAKANQISSCQDTGMAVVFLNVGQDVHITGGSLTESINEGVRQACLNGYLRKSIVKSPIYRVNTGDNTPAIIHTDIIEGDYLKITVAPKGFGSENMSALKMLKPSDGIDGIKDFVLDTVLKAGANPCPPIIVGIGIGGTMEKAALLAKKSLLRTPNLSSHDPNIAELEKELLSRINKTGIGPQGLGGKTTALAVHCESYPTHIAGLPVAVNIQCHASRHKTCILGGE